MEWQNSRNSSQLIFFKQVSLPPNRWVPSGRILRPEQQHMTDIIYLALLRQCYFTHVEDYKVIIHVHC
jgi:hypothetical protein